LNFKNASYEGLKKMSWEKYPGVPLLSPVSCLWMKPGFDFELLHDIM